MRNFLGLQRLVGDLVEFSEFCLSMLTLKYIISYKYKRIGDSDMKKKTFCYITFMSFFRKSRYR